MEWTLSLINMLSKRFTWWHPAHGTGHIIDHFFTNGNCFRVGRGDGEHQQAMYIGMIFTDHLPVEVRCHFWPTQDRTTSRQENGEDNIVLPQVEKLAVPGRGARELRKKWHELLQASVRDHKANKGYLGWEVLTTCVWRPVRKCWDLDGRRI